MPDKGFGIYIHWPFCQAKCPYCDFNSHVWTRVDQDTFVEAYEHEIVRAADLTGDDIVTSIFFGGGTPSLMNVRTVERILDRIRKRWRWANDVEVTLEANPTSIEAERFRGYRIAGVNRVSVGVQALKDIDLKRLGRLHSVEEALHAVDIARSTFDRVSFDLIYARQHQTLDEWREELKRALSFDPDHISLYQLTIEDGTAFGDRHSRGLLKGLPDEDLAADLWDLTQDMTNDAGLPAYEVSNHAKDGQESRHNLTYWKSGNWAGIGPGAHGRLTVDGARYETVSAKSPEAWLQRVTELGTGDTDFERMSTNAIVEEQLLMGIRMRDGIEMPSAWIQENLNVINDLVDLRFVNQDGKRLILTDKGRPLLNAIVGRLLSA